jgi:hypothetical protein
MGGPFTLFAWGFQRNLGASRLVAKHLDAAFWMLERWPRDASPFPKPSGRFTDRNAPDSVKESKSGA